MDEPSHKRVKEGQSIFDEEVRGNLACVSPDKAREIKDIAEAQVEPNVVIDFNREHHDEVIDKFTLPVDEDEINSLSLNLELNLNWPGTHGQLCVCS